MSELSELDILLLWDKERNVFCESDHNSYQMLGSILTKFRLKVLGKKNLDQVGWWAVLPLTNSNYLVVLKLIFIGGCYLKQFKRTLLPRQCCVVSNTDVVVKSTKT